MKRLDHLSTSIDRVGCRGDEEDGTRHEDEEGDDICGISNPAIIIYVRMNGAYQ
jgi:hypothetical protein